MPVVVVEREAAPHALPRAAHLDDEALRILARLGLAEALVVAGRPIAGMDIVDGRGRRLLRARKATAATREHGWPPALLVHQPAVERGLRDAVAACPSVAVRLGEAVERVAADAAGVTLHTSGAAGPRELRAAWVVGCDGARSVVREAMGARLRPPRGLGAAEQPWLVVDVRLRDPSAHPVPEPARLLQVADPDGPRTVVPFADPRRRWEWRLGPGEAAAAATRPEAVRARLAAVVDPDAVEVERAAVYTFRALVAAPWRRGRLLLAGDAAHQMPPFLGQGLCSGLRDADALAWRLALVAAGGAGAPLLDDYAAERRPHAARVTRLAGWAGRGIGGRGAAARARNAALRALHRLPPLAHRLADVRGDIRPVRAATHGQGVRRLTLVPNAVGGGRLDDALGDGWAALVRADAAPWHALADGPLGRRLGLRVAGGALARDPALDAAFDGRPALLVRPDGHLFGRYAGGASGAAARDLAAALHLAGEHESTRLETRPGA